MNSKPHPDHDRGLAFDLGVLSRRKTLGLLFGAAPVAALTACASSAEPGGIPSPSPPSSSASSSSNSPATAAVSPSATTRALSECGVETPDETAGPYPGNGSNGPNALEQSGIVRRDIRSSFGGGDVAKVEGVSLTLTLTILDNANGCSPYKGAAVYVWHCDREGKYSLYDSGYEDDNFLRGVQEADANGQVTFTTVFPGAYMGRWPHIHFEVFDSLNNINSTGQILKVSQVAMTEASCQAVYATAGYETSARNFPSTTLRSDNVFGDDGGIHQLATIVGGPTEGYKAALNVTL
ncbi:3,4-dioxygenase subunit beta [Arthrobacter woluwensis]|uniref:dioxygenase family protein n=1 Tax=Arthrobacter woluwensis TaxID=156980 RepID=UPI000D12C20C|nr:3,4-dioxygenase subunit beta [Arthrobacter woluwensis]PSS43147.1 3,4-dioxygenase subunit beta [Arthrobacter woluwensis]